MNKKGFTLIELIIVITILVILGTIAFIFLHGYSVESRDAKRITDVRNLLSEIKLEEIKGVSLNDLIVWKQDNEIIINSQNTKSKEGIVNFLNIKEKAENFQDPKNRQNYPIAYAKGITEPYSGLENNIHNGVESYDFIQMATVNEKKNIAVLLGNYYKINSNKDSPSLFVRETSEGEKKPIEPDGPIVPYDPSEPSNEPKEVSCDLTKLPSNSQVYNNHNTFTQKYNSQTDKYEPKEHDWYEHSSKESLECLFECIVGYVWNSLKQECEVDICKGTLPLNAESTASSQNSKTWWTYNSSEAGVCTYKCITDYTYVEEEGENLENPGQSIIIPFCKLDCTNEQNIEGYTVPSSKHNETQTSKGNSLPEKEIPYTNGTQIIKQDFKCVDGIQEKYGDIVPGDITCNYNYILNSTTKECEAKRNDNQSCTGLIENAFWTSTNSDSDKKINQIWNGTVWEPSIIGTFDEIDTNSNKCYFKCKDNYRYNGASCIANERKNQACTNLPLNAKWTGTNSTNQEITQRWNGSVWLPSLIGEFNVTVSNENCYFNCNDNYEWNYENKVCEGKTKKFKCSAKPSVGTERNTVYEYDQKWNGSNWIPEDSITVYSVTASTTACRYKCTDGYTWVDNICGKDCSQLVSNGYTAPLTKHIQSTTPQKTINITGGTQVLKRTFTCNNGTFTQGGDTLVSTNCNTGYTKSGNTCVPNNCAQQNLNSYVVPATNHGASTTPTRTVGITGGTQYYQRTFTCNLGTFSVGGETLTNVVCNTGYTKVGNTCNKNCIASTLNGYSVPATNGGASTTPQKTINITGGKQVKTQPYTCNNGTFTAGTETIISTTCNTGYTKSGNTCVPNNCAQQNLNSYVVPATNHGASTTPTRTVGITGGTQYYQRTFTCNLGTFSVGGETLTNVVCNTGYTKVGNTCNKNCIASTLNGYSVPATNGGASTTPQKTINITGGKQVKTQPYTCNNGTFTAGTETIISTTCNTGYTKSGNTCVPNNCAQQNLNSYVVPATNHGASTTPTRTVGITGGTQYYQRTFTCNLGTFSVGGETLTNVVCNTGYTKVGNTCNKNCIASTFNGYSVPATNGGASTTPQKTINITGGKQVKTQPYTCNNGTFTAGTETIISTTCNTGYTKSGNTCVPNNCAQQNLNSYVVPATNHGASTTPTRTVGITGGTQYYQRTFTCNLGTFSVGGETLTNVVCNTGYTKVGNTCNKNCIASTFNGYSVPATNGGASTTPQKTINITGGKQVKTQPYTCNNGTFTAGTETIISTTCNTGYTKSGNTCVPNNCAQQNLNSYVVPATNHGASTTPTRTVGITGGTQYYQRTFTCNLGTFSVGGETLTNVVCNTGYTKVGNTCNKNCIASTFNGYSVPATNGGASTTPQKTINITGGKQVKTQPYTCNNGTFTAGTETIISTTCNTGYTKSGNTCVPNNCAQQNLNSYVVPATNHGASTTPTRTVGITGGTQYYQRTFTCNLGTFSVGGETLTNVVCNSGYVRSGNICLSNIPSRCPNNGKVRTMSPVGPPYNCYGDDGWIFRWEALWDSNRRQWATYKYDYDGPSGGFDGWYDG